MPGQAVGVVDADGDGVGQCRCRICPSSNAGHGAYIGFIRHRVGGDLDSRPTEMGFDLQLIHVDAHFQIAQIIDDAEGVAGLDGTPTWRPFSMMVPLDGR